MILKQIIIKNYKNISNKKFDFSPSINCFVGLNGSGKTNILDSIYYLCFGRSYFSRKEIYNIKHNEKYSFIKGIFLSQEDEDILEVHISDQRGKDIKRNGKSYKKISEHLGNFLSIMISPSDLDLINEGSSERRKFIDSTISLFDRNYMEDLINYNKLLIQRNALLKIFSEKNYFDEFQINVYDEKLHKYGNNIYLKRKEFIDGFNLIFQENYEFISENKERVKIMYDTYLEKENLLDLFKKNIRQDLQFQYTTFGIHKDDFIFKIDDFNIKKYGSQGQQKTFLISLKIAKYFYILNRVNKKSLLILDDIFDKLDENRIHKLLHLVTQNNFSQIFISDTDKNRTKNLIEKISKEYRVFEI